MALYVSKLFSSAEEFEGWIESIKNGVIGWDKKGAKLSCTDGKIQLRSSNDELIGEVTISDNKTIQRGSGCFEVIGVKNVRDNSVCKLWIGTTEQYNKLSQKDGNTIYYRTDSTVSTDDISGVLPVSKGGTGSPTTAIFRGHGTNFKYTDLVATNIDNIKVETHSFINTTALPDGESYGFLDVDVFGGKSSVSNGSSIIKQTFRSYNSNKTYVRTFIGTSWTDWHNVSDVGLKCYDFNSIDIDNTSGCWAVCVDPEIATGTFPDNRTTSVIQFGSGTGYYVQYAHEYTDRVFVRSQCAVNNSINPNGWSAWVELPNLNKLKSGGEAFKVGNAAKADTATSADYATSAGAAQVANSVKYDEFTGSLNGGEVTIDLNEGLYEIRLDYEGMQTYILSVSANDSSRSTTGGLFGNMYFMYTPRTNELSLLYLQGAGNPPTLSENANCTFTIRSIGGTKK